MDVIVRRQSSCVRPFSVLARGHSAVEPGLADRPTQRAQHFGSAFKEVLLEFISGQTAANINSLIMMPSVSHCITTTLILPLNKCGVDE